MSHSPIWHPFTQHAVFPDSVFIELDSKQQAFLDAAELRAVDGTMTIAPFSLTASYNMFMARRCKATGFSA